MIIVLEQTPKGPLSHDPTTTIYATLSSESFLSLGDTLKPCFNSEFCLHVDVAKDISHIIK